MLGAQKRPNEVDRERGIYYLAVAGDVAQTWEQWQAGVADRGSASVTYAKVESMARVLQAYNVRNFDPARS
jgi:hypothetical protein